MMEALFLMLVGHAVADYPLQGDWLAKAKNPTIEMVKGEVIWPLALFSHALIHAGAVYLATGWMSLALIELFAHMAIDYSKCRGYLNYNQDQILHLVCKFYYAVAMI